MSIVRMLKPPATLAITIKYFQAVLKGISKIKRRKEVLLLKGMLNIRLIIQPLYFNEVCFTSSGICFVAQCKSLSISVNDKWFCLSRWRPRVLVGTGQAGHAGTCSCHSCPVSLWASKASASITQKLWVLQIRGVRKEPHADPTSGNTATGFLFMVILNMQQSFPNIRVINITAPSDLKSASVLLAFTERDKMLNYWCFEYEQI